MADNLSYKEMVALAKDPDALAARVAVVAEENKNLTPYIDKKHSCGTCKSKSGKCHPDTSYCFICDTDNWIGENW